MILIDFMDSDNEMKDGSVDDDELFEQNID